MDGRLHARGDTEVVRRGDVARLDEAGGLARLDEAVVAGVEAREGELAADVRGSGLDGGPIGAVPHLEVEHLAGRVGVAVDVGDVGRRRAVELLDQHRAVHLLGHVVPVAGDLVAALDAEHQARADAERSRVDGRGVDADAVPDEDVDDAGRDRLGQRVVARREAAEVDGAVDAVAGVALEVGFRRRDVEREGHLVGELGAVLGRVRAPGVAVVALGAGVLVDGDLTVAEVAVEEVALEVDAVLQREVDHAVDGVDGRPVLTDRHQDRRLLGQRGDAAGDERVRVVARRDRFRDADRAARHVFPADHAVGVGVLRLESLAVDARGEREGDVRHRGGALRAVGGVGPVRHRAVRAAVLVDRDVPVLVRDVVVEALDVVARVRVDGDAGAAREGLPRVRADAVLQRVQRLAVAHRVAEARVPELGDGEGAVGIEDDVLDLDAINVRGELAGAVPVGEGEFDAGMLGVALGGVVVRVGLVVQGADRAFPLVERHRVVVDRGVEEGAPGQVERQELPRDAVFGDRDLREEQVAGHAGEALALLALRLGCAELAAADELDEVDVGADGADELVALRRVLLLDQGLPGLEVREEGGVEEVRVGRFAVLVLADGDVEGHGRIHRLVALGGELRRGQVGVVDALGAVELGDDEERRGLVVEPVAIERAIVVGAGVLAVRAQRDQFVVVVLTRARAQEREEDLVVRQGLRHRELPGGDVLEDRRVAVRLGGQRLVVTVVRGHGEGDALDARVAEVTQLLDGRRCVRQVVVTRADVLRVVDVEADLELGEPVAVHVLAGDERELDGVGAARGGEGVGLGVALALLVAVGGALREAVDALRHEQREKDVPVLQRVQVSEGGDALRVRLLLEAVRLQTEGRRAGRIVERTVLRADELEVRVRRTGIELDRDRARTELLGQDARGRLGGRLHVRRLGHQRLGVIAVEQAVAIGVGVVRIGTEVGLVLVAEAVVVGVQRLRVALLRRGLGGIRRIGRRADRLDEGREEGCDEHGRDEGSPEAGEPWSVLCAPVSGPEAGCVCHRWCS